MKKLIINKDILLKFMSKVLNLKNKEDLQEFKDAVNSLKDNKLFSFLLNVFADEEDKNMLDELIEYADNYYDQHLDDTVDTDIDDEDEDVCDCCDCCCEECCGKEETFEIPSSKLSTEQGLQVHKLVQEYVDTMIKPFAPKEATNKSINDLYAGLYEFAAWIINK